MTQEVIGDDKWNESVRCVKSKQSAANDTNVAKQIIEGITVTPFYFEYSVWGHVNILHGGRAGDTFAINPPLGVEV